MMSSRVKKAVGTGLVFQVGLMAALFVGACSGQEEAEEVRATSRDVFAVKAAQFADEVELDAAQRERLDQAVAIVSAHKASKMAEREEHFAELRQAVEEGDLEEEEVHARIDDKIDEIRSLAHSVADELVPLVNSLDADQRQEALSRMDSFHTKAQRMHERMEALGGPRAFFHQHLFGDGE